MYSDVESTSESIRFSAKSLSIYERLHRRRAQWARSGHVSDAAVLMVDIRNKLHFISIVLEAHHTVSTPQRANNTKS